MSRDVMSDFAARAAVGALFALLTINLVAEFLRTGHITGLLFIVSEGLVVILTVIRRPARQVDRSAVAQVMTAVSLAGPPLLRVGNAPALVPDLLSAIVLALGTALVIAGKLALGRSFGLVPANRGVVARGPYNVVRHPIYSSYLITHVAFLAAHPTPLNAAILLVADSALVARALIEERVLGDDADYQAYCRRVEWHLVPGVF